MSEPPAQSPLPPLPTPPPEVPDPVTPVDPPAPPPAQFSAADAPAESGFTLRAVSLGFVLLLAWIFVINSSYPDNFYRLQQLIMLMGFGALLTMFFVKFLLGLLPAEMRLRPPETAVFFTMLLIGIPSSMLGRLALESAYVNHLFEIGDNRSGQLGFVPAHWAPEAHVRMPERRGMVEPLTSVEAAAIPARAESQTRALLAVQKTRVLYYDVLINYVAQQNPDVLAKMTALPKTFDAKALEVLNAQVPPELMKWLKDQPQLFFAATYCSMLDNLQQTSASGADPPWRNDARAFKDLFDQHSVAALEIFRPLNDVLEDAQRFSRYAQEAEKSPRIQIERTRAYEAATKAGKDDATANAAVAAAVTPIPNEEAFRAALAC
ncbi:MAG TPA: hypothetical protein VL860_04915, partial [Planctomycetota bacterium]|nr:hypothetical protein [Planctomycetota bacterium]